MQGALTNMSSALRLKAVHIPVSLLPAASPHEQREQSVSEWSHDSHGGEGTGRGHMDQRRFCQRTSGVLNRSAMISLTTQSHDTGSVYVSGGGSPPAVVHIYTDTASDQDLQNPNQNHS